MAGTAAHLQRRTEHAAFTLIELLVVVAIISLLISLLLPSLERAREQARQAVCQSNMKHLGLCFHFYAEDNRRHWPSYRYGDRRSSIEWYRLYHPYLVRSDYGRHPYTIGQKLPIFDCPSTRSDAFYSTFDSHRHSNPDRYPESAYRRKNFDYGLCADTYGRASREERQEDYTGRNWVDMREEGIYRNGQEPPKLRRLDDLKPEQELIAGAYAENPWWGTSEERYATRVEMDYCGPAASGMPQRGVGLHHANHSVSTLQADGSAQLQSFAHRVVYSPVLDR